MGSRKAYLTDWKTFLPSTKSKVPNTSLVAPFLSPFIQLLPSKSHSGWKSRHSMQPKRGSKAVSSIATP